MQLISMKICFFTFHRDMFKQVYPERKYNRKIEYFDDEHEKDNCQVMWCDRDFATQSVTFTKVS